MSGTRKSPVKKPARTWRTIFTSNRTASEIPAIGNSPSKSQKIVNILKRIACISKAYHASSRFSEGPTSQRAIEARVQTTGDAHFPSTRTVRNMDRNFQILVTANTQIIEHCEQHFQRCSENRYRARKSVFNSLVVSRHPGCPHMPKIQSTNPDFDVHLVVPLAPSIPDEETNLRSIAEQDTTIAVISCHYSIVTQKSSYFRDILGHGESTITTILNTAMTDIIVFNAPIFSLNNLRIALHFLYHEPEWQDLPASECLNLLPGVETSNLDPFSLYKVAVILGISSLRNWIANKLLIESMLHQSSAVSTLDPTKYFQLMQGNWNNLTMKGGCRCSDCLRSAPQVLLFSMEGEIKDATLERACRQALVGGFGLGWCTDEFCSMPPSVLESILQDLLKMITPRNSISLLFAAEEALAQHTPSTSKRLLMTARVTIEDIIAGEPDACFSSPEWQEIILALHISEERTADIVTKVRWVSEAISRSSYGPVPRERWPIFPPSLDKLVHSWTSSGPVDIDSITAPLSECITHSAILDCPPERETSIVAKRHCSTSFSWRSSLTNNTPANTDTITYPGSRMSLLSESTDYGLFYTRRGLSPSPSLRERPLPLFSSRCVSGVSVRTRHPRQEALLSTTAIGAQQVLQHPESTSTPPTLSYRSTVPLPSLSSSVSCMPLGPGSSVKQESLGFDKSVSVSEQSPPAYTRHAPKFYLLREGYARDPKIRQEKIIEEREDAIMEDGNTSPSIDSKLTTRKENKLPPEYGQEGSDLELVDNFLQVLTPFQLDQIPHSVDTGMHKERIDDHTLLEQENRRLKGTINLLESALIQKDSNMKAMSERLENYRMQARDKQHAQSMGDVVNPALNGNISTFFQDPQRQTPSDNYAHTENFYGKTTYQSSTTAIEEDNSSNEGTMTASARGEIIEFVTNGFLGTDMDEENKTLVQGEAMLRAVDEIRLDKATQTTQTSVMQHANDTTSEQTNSPFKFVKHHLESGCISKVSEAVSEPEPSFYPRICVDDRPNINIHPGLQNKHTLTEPQETYDTGVTLVQEDVGVGFAADWLSTLIKEPRSQSETISNLKDEVEQLREATKRMEVKLGILPFVPFFYSETSLKNMNIGAQSKDSTVLVADNAGEDRGIGSQLKELFHDLDRLENRLGACMNGSESESRRTRDFSEEKLQGSQWERTFDPKEVEKRTSNTWSAKDKRGRLFRASCHHDCGDDITPSWNHRDEKRRTEAQKCLDEALFNLLTRRRPGSTKKRTPRLFTRWRDENESFEVDKRSNVERRQKRRKRPDGRTW